MQGDKRQGLRSRNETNSYHAAQRAIGDTSKVNLWMACKQGVRRADPKLFAIDGAGEPVNKSLKVHGAQPPGQGERLAHSIFPHAFHWAGALEVADRVQLHPAGCPLLGSRLRITSPLAPVAGGKLPARTVGPP